MSRKYKFHDKEAVYFVSFATINWIDVFIRQQYLDCIVGYLRYCRNNKGMEIYGYCIMPSHAHLIFRSRHADPSGLLRDFKGHTSRQMQQLISGSKSESRREWILGMIKSSGDGNSNVKQYQFWQQHNKPIEPYTEKVSNQKLSYIHENPLLAGFVTESAHWK